MHKVTFKVTTGWCGAEAEEEMELTDEEMENIEDILYEWAQGEVQMDVSYEEGWESD